MKAMQRVTVLAVALLFFSSGMLAVAHVPYLERKDYTADEPFEVRKSIEQSIAVYAWLETDGASPCEDVDIYRFSIDEPSRVYIEGIVPVCEQYRDFAPLVCPGRPGSPLPTT